MVQYWGLFATIDSRLLLMMWSGDVGAILGIRTTARLLGAGKKLHI